MQIDGKPLSAFDVQLNSEVIPHASIVQLTGPREACKNLIFHLGCELRQKRRYGHDSYHLYDDRGEDCGEFHDIARPQLVFKMAWFVKQAYPRTGR
jgi:hypothetical protein